MSDTNAAQPGEDGSRTALLEEGARSFPEALTAIVEFRRAIRSICRNVLVRQLEDYGPALGINLKDCPITSWETSEDQVGGTFLVLGVQQIGFQLPPLLSRWCGSYFGLCWDSSETTAWFGACAQMYLNRARECEHIFNDFSARTLADPFSLGRDGRSLSLYMKLCPADMPSVEQKLEMLLSKWVELWRGRSRSPLPPDESDPAP